MTAPLLEILPTQRPLELAGERLAAAVAAVDARRGACRLALSGGSALAALPYALEDMPAGTWSRVQLTWVDERCVPPDHPDSNRGAWARLGLPPPGSTLPLWEADDDDPAAAARRVGEAFARELGGLDVALLGLGEDGHIASLFPGHPVLVAQGPVTFVLDSPKPPPRRMTLALPVLHATPLAIVVAAGASKRAALRQALTRDPALPTSALPHLVLVTDQELES